VAAYAPCGELRASRFVAIMRIIRTPEPPMPLRPHPFLALLLLAGLSLPASAQLDTTVRATNMRAGPDDAFPVVMRMPGSSNLSVVGCIESRTWCDVQAGRTRGWVREADLRPSSRLRSAPTVTFSVADYWDTHYRRRAWYASRGDWVGWGTPGFVAPGATSR
jgi:uncharacterized protein YraI